MKSSPLQYPQYVQRITLILASVLILGNAYAQQDTSLTKEFAELSAKERNRIAKKEESEAISDVAYQAIMTHAEELFRDKRFEESLEQYKVARNLRPYNVFPKVKIQDLNALLHLRAEQAPAPSRSNDGITIEKLERPPEPVIIPEPPPTPIKPRVAVKAPTNVPDQETRPNVTVEKEIITPVHADDIEPIPDGMVENYSKEGRALVCEREVTKEGKKTVYRRVVHPWGEKMYFKDRVAVPERIWVEAFGE
ncbi:MAG: hypothetical protein IPH21_16130 [Flavobacteriales bacterium]|nr:hypothetical protein [Flavobacteriales bacterium]